MKRPVIGFIIKVGLLTSPILFLLIIYLLLDPFKVIYKYSSYYNSGETPCVALNRDYVSTATFIQNYPTYKYDSYIFGNSRSIFYEVKEWQKYILSDKCYHFDASGETIYGINNKINFLKANNIPIKNALIILDYITLEGISKRKGILFMEHPKLSGESNYSFQIEYIKAFFDKSFLKAFFLFKVFNIPSNVLENRPLNYNSTTNEIKFDFYENMIKETPDDYYLPKKALFYYRDTIQKYSPSVINDKQKSMLCEIFNNLKADSTKYKIIINPLYDQIKLDSIDVKTIKSIFGKDNVFDFSGINQITNNLYNYYEDSHYRPHIAKKIINEIYNYKDTTNILSPN